MNSIPCRCLAPHWTFAALILGLTAAVPVGAQESTLLFKNDDFVTGSLIPMEDGRHVRWQCDAFKSALTFDLEGISSIAFDERDVEEGPEVVPSVRVTLFNGNRFYGELGGMDEEWVHLESERHGLIEFQRWAVERIDDLNGDGRLIFDGLLGADGWEQPGAGSAEDWRFKEGLLASRTQRAELFRDLGFNEPIVVDVEVECRGGPSFKLALGASKDVRDMPKAFSIELNGNRLLLHRQVEELVVEVNDEVEIKDTMALRIFFDPEVGGVEVHANGDFLGEFQDEEALGSLGTGIYLRNDGPFLRLKRFRVSRDDGSSLPLSIEETVLDGDFVSSIDEDMTATVIRDDREYRLVRGNYEAIAFADYRDGTEGGQHPTNVQVEYFDGSVVHGQLVATEATGLRLASDWATEPFGVAFKGLKSLKFIETTVTDNRWAGVLEWQGLRLHGSIKGGEADGVLRWQPAFSEDVVDINLDSRGRITFSRLLEAESRKDQLDELFLVNGDIVPCVVRSISETDVETQVAGIDKSVPRERVKAVRLRSEPQLVLDGIHDDGSWKPQNAKGFYELDEGRISFEKSGMLKRSLEVPDQIHISLDARWDNEGPLLITLGASERNPPNDNERVIFGGSGKPGLNVMLTRKDRKLTARGWFMNPGSFQSHNSSRRPRVTPLIMGHSRGCHIDIYIDADSKRFSVWAGGQEILRDRFQFRRSLKFDSLLVGVEGDNSSGVVIINGVLQTNSAPIAPVMVENLTVDPWAGYLGDERLQRLMTRRRGHTSKSITHVIRAHNGDVLRGRLIEMNEETVVFRSRLDTFNIPRTKVAELVDVRALEETVDWDEPDKEFTAMLYGGGHLTLEPLSSDETSLRGKTPYLGEVTIPWNSVFALELSQDGTTDDPYHDWEVRAPMALDSESCETPEADGEQTSLAVGDQGPDFELNLVNGEALDLRELRGQVVVLDFWATWCQPCVASLPKTIEVVEEFRPFGVSLLGISVGEERQEVAKFLEEKGWKFESLLDGENEVSKAYGARRLPTTVILDREGFVRWHQIGVGPDHETELRELLSRLTEL